MKKPPLKVGCASKMFETFSAAQSIKQRYKIYLSLLILEGYNFDSNQQENFSFYSDRHTKDVPKIARAAWEKSKQTGSDVMNQVGDAIGELTPKTPAMNHAAGDDPSKDCKAARKPKSRRLMDRYCRVRRIGRAVSPERA